MPYGLPYSSKMAASLFTVPFLFYFTIFLTLYLFYFMSFFLSLFYYISLFMNIFILSDLALLYLNFLLTLRNKRKDESQSGQYQGRNDIQCESKGVVRVHSEQAAQRGDHEAPDTETECYGIALHKTILRLELLPALTKGNIRYEHPKITKRHTNGIQLGKLL